LQRVVCDRDCRRCDLLIHTVAQEAGLSRDRCPVDRAGKMTCDASSNARIKNHSDRARFRLAGTKALDRTLSRTAANGTNSVEVSEVESGRVVVIAFFSSALTCKNAY